jgi:hypothetical protein
MHTLGPNSQSNTVYSLRFTLFFASLELAARNI